MPPTAPETTAHQILLSRPMALIMNHAATAKITGASRVPVRNATSGAALERARTMSMPQTDASRPTLASASGRNIMAWAVATVMVEAMAIQAIMEPQ